MQIDFVPPGAGEWALDRSHYPGGATPISQWLIVEGFKGGFGTVFAELGIPAERMDAQFVNGFFYTRLRPLIGPDKPPRKLPPTPILRLVTRLHPAFRARTKQATKSLRDRPSNEVVRRWNDEIRPPLRAANLAFQDVEPETLDDEALQGHLSDLLDHLHENFQLHFWLHGHDLGPVARYLHAAIGWGLEPVSAIDALAGASPTTSVPLETLRRLRTIVEESGQSVASLDDVRDLSEEARTLLDGHLADHGHVLATGYDLTAQTLHELPGVVLGSIRTARPAVDHDHEARAEQLRAQLDSADRAEFDLLLADARNVMDMRDDNGPLTVEWPAGLMRRALLAAGARLGERGDIAEQNHVFELTPDEVRTVVVGPRPSASELAERATHRAMLATLTPPQTLGDPEPAPPLEALPPVLAQLIATVEVAIKYMGMSDEGSGRLGAGDPGLGGVGIGTTSYIGPARVTDSADDAIQRLEPGDVLVVRATSPAFNAVLSIAGAVVTVDGGALSHAAVLARELGIPAIIGASGALSITDGAIVEVDPVAGTVRVVQAA